MGLSRLRPKAPVRYLDVICEEIITVVHESTVAMLKNFFYLHYVLHLKKVVSDEIKAIFAEPAHSISTSAKRSKIE